jgi:hypothetical protein
VETAYDVFDRQFRDEKNLANFALHMYGLPGGGTPTAAVDGEGKVRFPIPDRVTTPVYLFDQFTYNQGRDLVTFAREALDTVDQLIDSVLAVFSGIPSSGSGQGP